VSPNPRLRDQRGSSYDRRRRRAALLATFAVEGGTVCHLCGAWLDPEGDWHVDRFPVPGVRGGRYTRNNIRPSCAKCNTGHGLLLHPRSRA
jgi:hypothetical protein